ncbi:MAG: YHS domain-containing protein [Gammaproteobacteria bacterium]|nr:YHS domain-containing protein [Gammaproteobacteria bacterium]
MQLLGRKVVVTKANRQNVQCPVCHMMVNENNLATTYQARVYVFCSQQCRDRFESNPHLYTGRPGHPAPKQQGHEIIKTVKLKLTETLTDDQCFVIEEEIKRMMGIKSIRIESDCLSIIYDLLQVTAEQIETAIEKTGNALQLGLGTKLKQALVHYLEESELDNLERSGHGHDHQHT